MIAEVAVAHIPEVAVVHIPEAAVGHIPEAAVHSPEATVHSPEASQLVVPDLLAVELDSEVGRRVVDCLQGYSPAAAPLQEL